MAPEAAALAATALDPLGSSASSTAPATTSMDTARRKRRRPPTAALLLLPLALAAAATVTTATAATATAASAASRRPLSAFALPSSSASPYLGSSPLQRQRQRPFAPAPCLAARPPTGQQDSEGRGAGGVGLTREKAIIGGIGGTLGVWGLVTAAKNTAEKERSSVGARSFLWRPAASPTAKKTKEEGGGLSGPGLSLSPEGVFPLAFVTYLARFLLNFDSSVQAWWGQEVEAAVPRAYGRASKERQTFLMNRFGEFSTTVELGLGPFAAKGAEGARDFCRRLADRYIGPNSQVYPARSPEGRKIREQLALLFSLLPPAAQPTALIRDVLAALPPAAGTATARIFQVETLGAGQSRVLMDQTVRGMGQDPLMLLPARNMVPYLVTPGQTPEQAAAAALAALASDATGASSSMPATAAPTSPIPEGSYYRVPGLQSVMEAAYYGGGGSSKAREAARQQVEGTVSLADMPEATKAAVAAGDVESPFGPIAPKPYMKERALDFQTYLLFALAGAVGCAGTHTLVVPLDVVKTRKQTDKAKKQKTQAAAGDATNYQGPGLVEGVQRLWAEEGWDGLFRGVEPTVLGYLFYGVTVYPGYEFFKRALNLYVGPAAATVYHAPLVILAGALATVIACLGVCPAEAVRIRMVANRESFGETMTAAMAQEGGLPSLWDGFPPLLVRQVLFGMMKFLVFDSCASAIFAAFPALRAAVATSLAVSLVSGAVAGVASAVVSQPADTLLSRMNADSRPSLPEAAGAIWQESGPGGFFVGLGSRCLWSGSIISGQFLLYDVFRQLLHVTQDDLETYMDVIGSFQ